VALAGRAQIAMSDYEMEASLPVAQRALEMARRLDRMDIVSHAPSTQSLSDLLDSAGMDELHTESIAVAKPARSPVNLTRSLANGGMVNWYGLRFSDALDLFDNALATPEATTRAAPAGLTRRQMQVPDLRGEGLSNAAIAERLFVSAKTVDHHVSAILGKLDVAPCGEAAALARASGWVRSERCNAAPCWIAVSGVSGLPPDHQRSGISDATPASMGKPSPGGPHSERSLFTPFSRRCFRSGATALGCALR